MCLPVPRLQQLLNHPGVHLGGRAGGGGGGAAGGEYQRLEYKPVHGKTKTESKKTNMGSNEAMPHTSQQYPPHLLWWSTSSACYSLMLHTSAVCYCLLQPVLDACCHLPGPPSSTATRYTAYAQACYSLNIQTCYCLPLHPSAVATLHSLHRRGLLIGPIGPASLHPPPIGPASHQTLPIGHMASLPPSKPSP